MSNEETSAGAFTEHLESMAHATTSPTPSDSTDRMTAFADALGTLSELIHTGLEEVDESLQETVELLGKLADQVEHSLSDFNDDDPDVMDLVDFVVESCDSIRTVATGDSTDELDFDQLECLREAVELRLDSCDTSGAFGLDDATTDEQDDWEEQAEAPATESDVVAPSQEEIAALLQGLSAQTSGITQPPSPETTEQPTSDASANESSEAPAPTEASSSPRPTIGNSRIGRPDIDRVEIDEELREAFMDDATRGLESMEQALLDLESNPGDEGPVKTIGRELHTIKGASASIGMSNLAAYIHEVEELIRETQDASQAITPALLLPHVDLIRARVEGGEDPQNEAEQTVAEVAAGISPATGTETQSAPAAAATLPALHLHLHLHPRRANVRPGEVCRPTTTGTMKPSASKRLNSTG